jgi:hypothetical protein
MLKDYTVVAYIIGTKNEVVIKQFQTTSLNNAVGDFVEYCVFEYKEYPRYILGCESDDLSESNVKYFWMNHYDCCWSTEEITKEQLNSILLINEKWKDMVSKLTIKQDEGIASTMQSIEKLASKEVQRHTKAIITQE